MFPLVNGLENFYQDTEISMRIASRVGVDSFPLICIEVFQTTYQKISGYQTKGFAPFLSFDMDEKQTTMPMNNWIVPSNSSMFNLARFLSLHDNVVDWKQTSNFEIGDVVYIYCTKPQMRIRYKMEVIAVDIPFSKSLKDKSCWKDEAEFKNGMETNRYFRMKLISETFSDKLTMDELHSIGVKGWIQSPRKIEKEVVTYIESSIK